MLDQFPNAGIDSASVGRESLEKRPPIKLFASAPTLLCVRPTEPSWVAMTLGFNSAGLEPPRLIWVSTPIEAVSKVREERFDCVLVDAPATGVLLQGGTGPIGLIRALRSGGCDDPVILVGRLLSDADWSEACALDCDVFVSHRGWESPALGAMVKRAVLRGELVRESRRLATADQRRLVRDRDESEQLLAQQRQIIEELESLADPLQELSPRKPAANDRPRKVREEAPPEPPSAANEIAQSYAGLLRSYVLMGSGSLAADIADMADRLIGIHVTPPEALELHVKCVEELVKGLGNRSARHVVSRADLLAVEMMMHLANRSQRVAGAFAPETPPRPISDLPLKNVTGAAGIDLSDAA